MQVNRRAFTLIEMLVTCAVLVIVMGLMVSLARHVRSTSANELTARHAASACRIRIVTPERTVRSAAGVLSPTTLLSPPCAGTIPGYDEVSPAGTNR